jgi:two-component system, cell cycle sensor histidine kinase and response regulator CckA
MHEIPPQFSSLLHALPGMAFRTRAGGAREILFVSDGVLGLTGHPAADFLAGRVHFRDFVHPNDLPRVRAATDTALKERGEFDVEYRMRARDGGEKWVRSRGRGVYDSKNNLEFVEGLAIDITPQKKAEAERELIERKLLEGQKLESLGLLAGGVAHDFNNLLTGVIGNASLLRLALPPNDENDPLLQGIETASMRAAELCRQLLAYAGKGRRVIEPTALNALVEGMLPLLKTSTGSRVRMHLDLAAELPAVTADATQLRQIVMNLVINASDAIGEKGGDIHLATRMTPVDAATFGASIAGGDLPAGDYVSLEVRDTGSGMSPEVLKKIFEPFFSTKVAGRGLGLSAVRGIVRNHHGALTVESTPGVGSSFRLFLPPSQDESAPAAPPPTATPWSHSARVLVIEDDETVRTVAADALRSYGLSPQMASGGEDGIALFEKDPAAFDLVLLDLVMPGLSGEETLTRLRAARADATVLMMSGYTETDTIARLAAPPSRLGFLQKPFTREMLKVKVRDLLS